ncbi:MAG TPA: PEGA domain-containing protein [Kofleriaceae bacterium]|jgi:hypothetical protein|nr:PEGA domain-containing protein [Kofleriaceae bacterium]
MRCLAVFAAVAMAGCHHAEAPPEPHYNGCGGTGDVLRLELGVDVIETPADSPAHTVTFKSMHRGVILIDGEVREVLRDVGITTVDVPAGKHRLQLEVEGYRLWERDVDVKPDAGVLVTVR